MEYPQWIVERAFGGTDVADTPGSKKQASNWHEGPSMPASREACDLLVSACNAPTAESTAHLFLVGGAGNGKSYLARHVVSSVSGKLRGNLTAFASRVYEIELDQGGTLRVVNDATIPPSDAWESGGDALRDDVDTAINDKGHLLCCVNRGVLVRETRDSHPDASIGKAILCWLAKNAGEKFLVPSPWEAEAEPVEPARDHYAFAKVTHPDGRMVSIHVVFMDNASLLEPISLTATGSKPSEALVTSRRSALPVLRSAGTKQRMATAAIRDTVAKFAAEIGASECGLAMDPVCANAQMLSQPEVAAAWTSAARCAEIISGTHFTYRDLWGLASLSVTGTLQGQDMAEHGSWVAAEIGQLESSNVDENLESALRLASLRTHQALFAATLPQGIGGRGRIDQAYPSVQAIKALQLADPVRDLHADVRRLVSEKMFLLEENARPGKALADEDPAFKLCWTGFDDLLEGTVVSWINGEEGEGSTSSRTNVPRRRAVISWYGEYLARLCSFARGLAAFPTLVDLWQKSWESASVDPSIDEDLRKGLLNLLLPASNGKSLLPVFDEHIVPPGEGGSAKSILIQLVQSDYRVRATTRGDRLLVQLSHDLHESQSKELVLDFPLLRETVARNNGVGFTEAMFDVEPRVERMRANAMMLAATGDIAKVKRRIVFATGERLVAATGQ